MSVLTLQANSHIALPYSVAINGQFRYEVESEFITTTYIMDTQNLAFWKAGQSFLYQAGSATTFHHQVLKLPPGLWFLVIANYQKTPTAVHYTVWLG